MARIVVEFDGHIMVDMPDREFDDERFDEAVQALSPVYAAIHALDGALYVTSYDEAVE